MYLPLFFLCEIYKKSIELTDAFVQVNCLGFGVKTVGSPDWGWKVTWFAQLHHTPTAPLSLWGELQGRGGKEKSFVGAHQAQQGLLSVIQFFEVPIMLFLLKVIDQTALRNSHT